MAPETAKIKAEMAARLKGGVAAERKKHNSEEDGNAAKKMKMSPADEGAASIGGGGGEKPEERDLKGIREARVMFTNLDKEYVERLKPQLVAIGIEVGKSL